MKILVYDEQSGTYHTEETSDVWFEIKNFATSLIGWVCNNPKEAIALAGIGTSIAAAISKAIDGVNKKSVEAMDAKSIYDYRNHCWIVCKRKFRTNEEVQIREEENNTGASLTDILRRRNLI